MAVSIKISFTSLFFFGFLLSGSYATIFTITNNCSNTVWTAILSAAAGTWPLPTPTGFALQPGESNTVDVPPSWSGRLWGRTFCSNNITGNFSCVTGDCGLMECAGRNATLPVTLAEFTLNNPDGLDYFDVSLRDGFNLPVGVEPRGGTGARNCRATSCGRNLNQKCPIELKVKGEAGEGVVACKSAYQAEACNSAFFSHFFKSKCPEAYGHVTFTCASSADYTIIFCPYDASSTSSSNPGNKKMDNSGGHVDGFRIPTATAVVLVFLLFGYLACRTRIRYSNRDWEINMVAGTRAEPIAPIPNPLPLN